MIRLRILIAGSIALMCLGGCSVLDVVNALIPSDTYTAYTDLPYGPHARERLDVYEPRGIAGAKRPPDGYPVIVFFYGGSWNSGSRVDYRFVGEALASRGFLAVLADYRHYPEVTYPDFLEDSAAAVAWARREATRYGGDPKRLYAMGHSAGAYNAAMLALDPRWLRSQGLSPSDLKGWIGLAGPYDFLPSDLPDVQPIFHHPNYPRGAQPIEHISRSAPRTFLGAAIKDSVVSPTRSTQQMADKLRAAGVPLTLEFYEGVSHITLLGALARPLRGFAPVLEDVAAFVRSDGAS